MKKGQISKSIEKSILESSKVIKNSNSQIKEIEKSIKVIIECLKNGKKIVIFGNGGSAADAQHIVAEFIGRFKLERKCLPAIALTSNTSILTALANDYSFDSIFSRQCEGLVEKGDVVIGISTSGNSTNVKKGLVASKKIGALTIGLLGSKGGTIGKICNISIIVKSSSTPRIQEAHRTIYHIICEEVEKEFKRL
ncbi:D-sedoheptulose-7-phosphate isomerase [Candidatus Nitrosarchaeum limnium]|uniref:Probable phosphoheptose isomerase n=1 Tax=Candidatus Nitrosarchaeum limnium BG20 TaxID=859192 RepID=S2EKX2_9ARCH|nr:D-sedoheptulose 7-phosphate isomerase [Candidatus Nitrosarchaeum limnium]EPA05287.1 putative phosphoheptose isomerase [Candidatus Nitrosarchaeum limnium BG20]